jgi:hypothetical protein
LRPRSCVTKFELRCSARIEYSTSYTIENKNKREEIHTCLGQGAALEDGKMPHSDHGPWKTLVHYKMLRDVRQMRRTQMSRIDSMEGYLKTNRAQLVEKSAVAA